MSAPLETVEVGPADASAAVVWLHGLGASGHDFEPIVPMLGLPQVRFVFPHAPTRPVTLNMGFVMHAWYDIRIGDVGFREPEEDVRASAELVEALIAREEARGVPSSSIVLAGFSQGGAMALHVGTRLPRPLAGIMVLSAYHLLPDRYPAERSDANLSTSMLFCHGRHDPLVPMQRGRTAYDAVSPGHPAAWHDFDMQHEVCPDEIAVIRDWLHQRLGSPDG